MSPTPSLPRFECWRIANICTDPVSIDLSAYLSSDVAHRYQGFFESVVTLRRLRLLTAFALRSWLWVLCLGHEIGTLDILWTIRRSDAASNANVAY